MNIDGGWRHRKSDRRARTVTHISKTLPQPLCLGGRGKGHRFVERQAGCGTNPLIKAVRSETVCDTTHATQQTARAHVCVYGWRVSRSLTDKATSGIARPSPVVQRTVCEQRGAGAALGSKKHSNHGNTRMIAGGAAARDSWPRPPLRDSSP